LESAQVAAEDGIDLEVIDARSLAPVDHPTIAASGRRTGRLLITHEAPVLGGLGGEIAARISEQCFYHLEAPVLRVGGYHLPYPPARMEHAYLPDPDRVPDGVDRLPEHRRTRPARERTTTMTAASADPAGSSAPQIVTVPLNAPGEGLAEAEILEIKVAVGDRVEINAPVVEVETAKSAVELSTHVA